MRRALWALVFVVVLASAGAAFPPQQQTQQPPPPPQQSQTPPPPASGQAPTTVVQVPEVDILFAVVNRKQQFVTDLQQSDFKVFEDNKEQKVKYFSRMTDLPLRIALLIDTSNSIRPRLQFEKDSASDFLYNVIRPGRDYAFLMTFDSDPEVVQGYSNDVEVLKTSIDAQKAGGGTSLYDAMVKASQMLEKGPLPKTGSQEFRRIIVVISDGDDNLSASTRKDAIDAANRSGVGVYAVSTSTQWVTIEDTKDPSHRMDRKWEKTDGDKVLEFFSDETGGRAFFPFAVDDVANDFLEIATELRSQYLIGYQPTNTALDGKYHKVRIEVVGHSELEVRHRKGYNANPPIVITRPATASSGN
jgi:Ca-activated chloride channel family protein